MNICDFSLIHCPEDMFKCVSTGYCIDDGLRCNGEIDCLDGSDEGRDQKCGALLADIDCGETPSFEKLNGSDWYMTVSKGGNYKCKNGQCIPGQYMCDGIVDCIDGSDEYPHFESAAFWPFFRECPYAKLIECGTDEILCKANGKCLNKLRVCDGIQDCPNGEDEQGCAWIWGHPWCDFLEDKFQCGGNIAKWNKNDANKSIILFENHTRIYYESVLDILKYASGIHCIDSQLSLL